MRTAFWRLAIIALLGSVTACTSGNANSGGRPDSTAPVAHVTKTKPTASKITVTVPGGCPETIGFSTGVDNAAAGLTQRLLPSAAAPSSGLICEFGATQSGQPLRVVLKHVVRLNRAKANALARAVDRLSLAPLTGPANCPMDFYGAATIIALAYQPDRTVDLHFHTAGCRTLDNGYVVANEIADPAFYNGFERTFTSMAPTPATRP